MLFHYVPLHDSAFYQNMKWTKCSMCIIFDVVFRDKALKLFIRSHLKNRF
jgi:hypothetical protein